MSARYHIRFSFATMQEAKAEQERRRIASQTTWFEGQSILGKPTFKQILEALKRQVLFGRSYLNVAKGLLAADPVILQTAPTFFGLTIDGSIELAQMAIARMYDVTRGSVTIPRMLDRASEEAASFQHADERSVKAQIAKWKAVIVAVESVLESIRHRRNEWLAHLDPRTVANPAYLSAKAQLTIPDLERAFRETEKIVLDMSLLYEGVFGELRFIGDDDYEVALDWIRSAKCTAVENYEKEFHAAWDGPRPKDCSHNVLKMP